MNSAHPDDIELGCGGVLLQAEATLARFVSNILSCEFALTGDFKPHIYYVISDVIDDKVDYNPLSQEIYEGRREVRQENPVLNG